MDKPSEIALGGESPSPGLAASRVARVAGALPRFVGLSTERYRSLRLVEMVVEPAIIVASLWLVALLQEKHGGARYIILSVLVFALMFPGSPNLSRSFASAVKHNVLSWVTVSLILLCFGAVSGYLAYFPGRVLWTWWWTALVAQIAGLALLRNIAPALLALEGQRRAIVAGLNEQSLQLQRRLASDPYSLVRVAGFFDDRAMMRSPAEHSVLGTLNQLPEYAKRQRIDIIYIALPMASQPRILALLNDLRDTTASIYFVPDIFVTDLIQGRMDSIGGVPVVGVCESPFKGFDGMAKRLTDLALTLLLLFFVLPVMALIGTAIKLTSPGSIIFRQRRYGLDGSEIVVYKFRTMSVSEDSGEIRQARADDQRVTPIGRLLRRTSLDELPQLINVLQGRMSLVGPRPHAIAHNELYRKLIDGYMVRHKVRPGITGWAQINGYRGETSTVDKMKGRIDHDLHYLRHWSLRLDFYILARTFWVVASGKNAY